MAKKDKKGSRNGADLTGKAAKVAKDVKKKAGKAGTSLSGNGFEAGSLTALAAVASEFLARQADKRDGSPAPDVLTRADLADVREAIRQLTDAVVDLSDRVPATVGDNS